MVGDVPMAFSSMELVKFKYGDIIRTTKKLVINLVSYNFRI